ncbi:MAG: DUF86 domain-containing protein [Minisyncoccales bacterium]
MKKERNIKVYLDDILESIGKIEKYTEEVSEEEFYKNDQLQDSILRRLEVIGEAVNNIPKEFRDKYSKIPWRKISGIRNVLIHEYFGVNMKRVWKVIVEDISKLKEDIIKIKKEID